MEITFIQWWYAQCTINGKLNIYEKRMRAYMEERAYGHGKFQYFKKRMRAHTVV